MAWRSSGSSNKELVENMQRNELITDHRIANVLLQIDRAHYAPREPYSDSPQTLSHGATISAPHMHAMALMHLLPYASATDIRPAPRVLDIGSGSGYLTHALALLAGGKGRVVGVEHVEALRALGETNMCKSTEGQEMVDNGRVVFVKGDGRRGWKEEDSRDVGVGEENKWDAIHVGACAEKLHEELVEQLRAPGRLFIPIDDSDGSGSQSVWTITKNADGSIASKRLFGVRYVKLTDAKTQIG
ncbi:hypothetical protein Cpir12675_000796 [Ceratocystis pirilliformis]|uniref:protein-L-isoaspartate(D-aspartate) O-methyltransferase n=1 Tax=Ceratocystis pirilliformis TaxID=259994 RepID=A0ABR3ZKS4_9PEZI